MKNTIIIILVIAAAIGITLYSQSSKTPDTKLPEQLNAEVAQEDNQREEEFSLPFEEDPMLVGGAGADAENPIPAAEVEIVERTKGAYVDINNTDIAELSGKIVLDFSATWCPSCRTFKKNVEDNLDAIPADLTLILVDYDSNTELKKKYAVVQQHTFVQIDNQGNQIQKWSGGSTLASVVEKL